MKAVAQAVMFTLSLLSGCVAALMWVALSAPDLTRVVTDERTLMAQAFGSLAVILFTLAWLMGDL